MAGTLKILTVGPSGALIVGLTTPPKFVEGIDKLVQIVAIVMLSNGERSIANPNGGGVRKLMGANYDPEDPSELFADVRIMVTRTEQIIKESQVLTRRPASERLLQLQLIDIMPNEENLSVEIAIGVINEEQNLAQSVVSIR